VCARFRRLGTVAACLLLCTGLPACSAIGSEERPVPEETLIEVLIELHLAGARAGADLDVPPGLRDSILTRYGLDDASFAQGMEYYVQRPDDYAALYNTVLDRLSAESLPAPE
jgi:hypothetical protein